MYVYSLTYVSSFSFYVVEWDSGGLSMVLRLMRPFFFNSCFFFFLKE